MPSRTQPDSPESSDKLDTSSVLRVRALFPVNGLEWRKCGYRLRYSDSVLSNTVGVFGGPSKEVEPLVGPSLSTSLSAPETHLLRKTPNSSLVRRA